MIEDVILFQLDKTNKNAKMYAQREFDRLQLGITVDQWVLLKIIEESEQLSQIELAEKSLRDPASITRTLDLLEKKLLLRREPIIDNRRQYRVALTRQGKAFVRKHMAMVIRHRKRSVRGFSAQELEQLKAMLLRIQENMS
jgi:DNA-binding MarR family transcriptional regulator